MICRICVCSVLPIGCFYLIMTSKEKFCAFSLWSRFYSLKQEPYRDVQRASEKATSILLSKEQHFLLSSFLTIYFLREDMQIMVPIWSHPSVDGE